MAVSLSLASGANDSFLGHVETRELSDWETMRRTKNRRLCTSIREAMDSVKRQHRLELRNHRHGVAMRRHRQEVAKARDAQAKRDAVKRRLVEEVIQKREAQADATERRLQEAQARANAEVQARMDGIQRKFEARRQREANKAVRRQEAVEQSIALQHKERVKFQQSAEVKARRLRRQQRKNEQLEQKHADFVKRLTSEKRANTVAAKNALLLEAEERCLQREKSEARRNALRMKHAAELQHRRKLIERDLWIEADNAKKGLTNFLQSGKADSALLSAVRDAQDTELETMLLSTSTKLAELSLSRHSQSHGKLPAFILSGEEPPASLNSPPSPSRKASAASTLCAGRQSTQSQQSQYVGTTDPTEHSFTLKAMHKDSRPDTSPIRSPDFCPPRLSLLA